ncbi:methionyl-tRNA formyltransferase [Myroides odoratimimus]|uniref:methionyl-tRNA formyltransferase n=1 Tax=Myroides odoratimimus TaxID=76832 RepID=UPI00103FC110|nr:methionyl-tRNA formyltransferase [Myroides odoratimimus]MCA4792025.1 methionyl-tRNA formyltransferase [Myroides odoratimimus]MCA4805772.1 methionyl-tRNA formyltransferase [Myroides odoratimimus]MCA4819312.1 methionyl-tRNA formyltransferase [Myroides odoratimimus]MCO7723552.1 methionyl-tRNA formyltransferase [Myroides odoratimimus]MCS7472621.1 methionyl-tRNA formyltransferase [Myroides odoratimimus]
MKDLRIVFMGTPDFAVGILDAIYTNNYNVVAVITAPDRPAGRGQKIKYSAVKEYALEKNLPILQPTNLKDEQFLEELKSYNANLNVVVAFRMLPEVVWKMPELGTFNLHASLLPDYRGAAPINWAIINGETTTGVSTFFIDEKIDTGAIILKKELNIGANENAGELHDRLMVLGASTVLETLELIKESNVTTTTQPKEETKTAYKLNKDNTKIDFTQTGQQIHNLIRGLSPYPTAWCFFQDKSNEWTVKIYEANYEEDSHNYPIGKVVSSKKELKIAVEKGFINILRLQFPGKKPMKANELLNGVTFTEDAIAI